MFARCNGKTEMSDFYFFLNMRIKELKLRYIHKRNSFRNKYLKLRRKKR